MGLWRSADGWASDFQRKPGITVFKAVFWIVLLGVFVVVVLWTTGVVTAPWKGKGDAYIQKNSADNWVAAQRTFHQENNDYTADLVKIRDAKTALTQFEAGAKPHPNSIAAFQWQQQDTNLRTTLTGLEQGCEQVAANYATDAQSYLTESFRDAGLPATLDAAACSR
jgi:hypothetical protein